MYEMCNFSVLFSSFVCLHSWIMNVNVMIIQLFCLVISPSVLKKNTGKQSDS